MADAVRGMLDDLLDKPRAIVMLGKLLAKGEVNMKTFTMLADVSPRHAQELREWMEARSLLHVEKAPYGPTDIVIRLTPFGEKAAKIFEDADARLEKEKAKDKGGGRKR